MGNDLEPITYTTDAMFAEQLGYIGEPVVLANSADMFSIFMERLSQ